MLALFDKQIEKETEEVRIFRIDLNKEKVKKMLGQLKIDDQTEIKRLLGLYLKYAKLDGKPEKGERKMADDFVLLLNEAIGELVEKVDRKTGCISE